MSIRPEILRLIQASEGKGLVGSGLVGGDMLGGGLVGGDLLGGMMGLSIHKEKGGKLPKVLREALAERDPEYKAKRKAAKKRFKAHVASGKIVHHPAGSAEAIARGKAAAKTRKDNTDKALAMTKKQIESLPGRPVTAAEASKLYKENKRLVSLEHKKRLAASKPKKSAAKVVEEVSESEEESDEE